MKWFKFRHILMFLLFLMMIGVLYQYIANVIDEHKFPPIGKMIQVGDHKLHMLDMGTQKKATDPVVILEAGLGGNCLGFSPVQSEIAKFARVISYDRAGQGWSEAGPFPRTAENIVQDLHTMLHNAGVPAPYLLVGHSFGGVVVRLFASKYPNEVAGVILLDASHENVFDYENISTWSQVQRWYDRLEWYFAHYVGIERFEMEWNAYKHRDEPVNNRSYRKKPMFVALRVSNKVMHTKISEHDNFPLSCQQLKYAENGIVDKPLTVVSAGKKMWLEAKKNKPVADKWTGFQADLVIKSKLGKQIIAEKSGHDIMTDQPEIVVQVVRDMIEQLQKNNKVDYA